VEGAPNILVSSAIVSAQARGVRRKAAVEARRRSRPEWQALRGAARIVGEVARLSGEALARRTRHREGRGGGTLFAPPLITNPRRNERRAGQRETQ
jgi:hypothetical protein